MQRVHCPHCSTELTNDGSLCGQLATCAACGGLFEMPPLPPAAVVEAPAAQASEEAEPDPGPRRRRRQARGGGAFVLFTILALVVMPLTILAVGTYLITSGASRGKQEQRVPPPPKKKAR